MKLLLDENLPKRLKTDLPEHEVFTIQDMGWRGKDNGDLMKLMLEKKFDALITFDKNLEYQQNFKKYKVAVLVLNAKDNSYEVLKNLVPKIKMAIKHGLRPGSKEIK